MQSVQAEKAWRAARVQPIRVERAWRRELTAYQNGEGMAPQAYSLSEWRRHGAARARQLFTFALTVRTPEELGAVARLYFIWVQFGSQPTECCLPQLEWVSPSTQSRNSFREGSSYLTQDPGKLTIDINHQHGQ